MSTLRTPGEQPSLMRPGVPLELPLRRFVVEWQLGEGYRFLALDIGLSLVRYLRSRPSVGGKGRPRDRAFVMIGLHPCPRLG